MSGLLDFRRSVILVFPFDVCLFGAGPFVIDFDEDGAGRRRVEVVEAQVFERKEAGLPLDGLPDLDFESERDGFLQCQVVYELAARHITAWMGIEDDPPVTLEGGGHPRNHGAQAPATPYTDASEERTHFAFGAGEAWGSKARVIAVKPRGEHVEITAVAEDVRVHQADAA